MTVSLIPADIKLHDRVGRTAIRSNIERGDTVTFTYDGERRTVLVLENNGRHLKGVAKERNCDYRQYTMTKIVGLQYAKPFVKQNVAVSYEVLPEPPTPKVKVTSEVRYGGNMVISITKPNGEYLNIFAYPDGRIGLCGDADHRINSSNVDAKTFFEEVSKMAE